MQNKKKTALVTGGAGFIGSHMVDLLLKKKYLVIVLDDLSGGHLKNIRHNLKKIKLIKDNVLKINNYYNQLKNVNYVYHFAGRGDIVPSIEKPYDYFNINVMGTVAVLELCRKLKKLKKIVYAASSSCYGIAKVPTKEDHKISTKYPYALSKYLGEKIIFHYSKVYNLKVNSIRIFNAYGPRVRTTGAYGAVFGVFLKQKLLKKPFTVVGNGQQKRDFLHVTDVANAFFKTSISNKKNKIYNLGFGKPHSINYLLSLIGGKKIYLPKRPGEPQVTWANISKIKKDIKWKPFVSFELGVSKMLENLNEWKNAPLWNKKKINKATKIWFKYLK